MILNTIDMTHLLSLFSFNRDEPMLFTSGLFWVLFLVFLPLYALIKSRRKKMMVFVIAFSLFFFYKSSGMVLPVAGGDVVYRLVGGAVHRLEQEPHRAAHCAHGLAGAVVEHAAVLQVQQLRDVQPGGAHWRQFPAAWT